MARHMEQPGSRHSKPADIKISSRPSSSACFFISPDPGTTIAKEILPASFRPLTTSAAARRSSMREFVHEPIKILSSLMSEIGVPGNKSIYSRALRYPSLRVGSSADSGSGTLPEMGAVMSGDVPQVTNGSNCEASNSISLSKCASGSLTRLPQAATARSHISPLGANGRPLRYSTVLSSHATIPARAPASMVILHNDILPSMDMPLIASPAYSIV
ncbi:MAG: hypothetical protein MAG794_01173 [Gammaproteobacteria bacterium]|nr:hypothetical protein [Gammaproteobacteria bacterium]